MKIGGVIINNNREIETQLSQKIKILPLVWKKRKKSSIDYPTVTYAESPFCEYRIEEDKNFVINAYQVFEKYDCEESVGIAYNCMNIVDAQERCQKHHNSYLLSQLANYISL